MTRYLQMLGWACDVVGELDDLDLQPDQPVTVSDLVRDYGAEHMLMNGCAYERDDA